MAKKTTPEERPYAQAKADPKDIAKAEDRQPDQDPTYHVRHPTLGAKHTRKSEDKAPPEPRDS